MKVKDIVYWLNSNEGLLGVILFFASLLIGWMSGIFSALVRKPKFKIRVIPKLTFGSIFLTGEQYTPPGQGTYDIHKTAFVIYLQITNIGSAPSEIGKIRLGYYRDNGKSTIFQKRLWIKQSNILADFGIPTGDGQIVKIKHLHQVSPTIDYADDSYLEVGQSQIGAAYFEQEFSWGNHYPRTDENGFSELKIKVKDAFDNVYSTIVKVPIKTLEEAHRYNPRFGFTQHLFDKGVEDLLAEDKKSDSGGEK